MSLPSLPAIRAAAAAVAAEAGYDLVILFGSLARGESGARDVDLGVLARPRLAVVDATNRLMRQLGVNAVDVADLGRADPVLLMAAARRYADTAKFRDALRDQLRDFAASRP